MVLGNPISLVPMPWSVLGKCLSSTIAFGTTVHSGISTWWKSKKWHLGIIMKHLIKWTAWTNLCDPEWSMNHILNTNGQPSITTQPFPILKFNFLYFCLMNLITEFYQFSGNSPCSGFIHWIFINTLITSGKHS